MAKYKQNVSKQTVQEADKIAKATQRPGQSKEQTKLIAQGIQKGIEQFKKQQKSKSRELDKKLKSIPNNVDSSIKQNSNSGQNSDGVSKKRKTQMLPWILLIFSWLLITIYLFS